MAEGVVNEVKILDVFSYAWGGIRLRKLRAALTILGIIIGITEELKIPIRYIGVGEGIDDLKEFNATEFVQALF